MEPLELIKTGSLLDISKGEDDGAGSASFSIATEGEYDKEGDFFKAGSMYTERAKATLVSFMHNNEPAGTWTMRKDGLNVIADVEFLDTETGQDVRKYLKAMGDSAQFSFRGRAEEWVYDENWGRIIEKACVYEASPVLMGAGNDTRLEMVKNKSKEGTMGPEQFEKLLKSLQQFTVDAIKKQDEGQSEATKGITETLTKINESLETNLTAMNAVKDAVTPTEPPADPMGFNVIKDYNKDRPVFDLAKMMFDKEFKERMDVPRTNFSVEKNVPIDLLKASINSMGTIMAAPAVPLITTPIGALDASYVQPWNAEVYRRRTISRTSPEPLARGNNVNIRDATETADVEPLDYVMRTIASKAAVSRLSAMADASVMSSLTEMGLMDLRVQLQDQIVSGDGTGQNLPNIGLQSITPAYGGKAANRDNVQAGDANKGVLNGTNGIYQAILNVRGRGGMANYVLAGASDVGKIYASLENKRSPFPATQQLPYGSPMGAGVILSPQMPANTIDVVSLGMPTMHVVPMLGSFRVNVSYDARLEADEVLMTFVCYAQNVVQNPDANQRITATNLLEVEDA